MRRVVDRRLKRLEIGTFAIKHGVALVHIAEGEDLEEALTRQGIDRSKFDLLFVIADRNRMCAS
jgi:hypothetical protein